MQLEVGKEYTLGEIFSGRKTEVTDITPCFNNRDFDVALCTDGWFRYARGPNVGKEINSVRTNFTYLDIVFIKPYIQTQLQLL